MQGEASADKAARTLAGTGVGTVILKAGAHGSYIIGTDEVLHVPSIAAMPNNYSVKCRCHRPKQKFRVQNWREYDAGLRRRGRVTNTRRSRVETTMGRYKGIWAPPCGHEARLARIPNRLLV
jgi:hypothetical protein